jgi:hypothetical protein
LIRVAEGVFLLLDQALSVEGQPRNEHEQELDKKILDKLVQSGLKERVEGRFERMLNEQERKRFEKLVAEGRVIKFKLSDKYKKAVYKLPEELNKSDNKSEQMHSEEEQAEATPLEVLETQGYVIIDSEAEARRFSETMRAAVQSGEVRGVKSFDGKYYVISTELLERYAPKVLSVLSDQGPASVEQISAHIKTDSLLVKTVCELLRESGQVVEKRRNIYALVE